jgi:hypothetical protein
MRVGGLLLALGCGIGLATAGALPAHAAEARPWLCRDKPVFSSSSAMTYQGAGQASGTLVAGRYFAVAMYRGGGGHWICPGYAQDKDRPAGALSRICYGEEASSCPVTLTVVATPSPGAASH